MRFARPSPEQLSCAPQVVLEGGWHNRVALPVLDALGVAVMRTWNSSLPLWQYHHSYPWPVRARCCMGPEQSAESSRWPMPDMEMECHVMLADGLLQWPCLA